MVIFDVNGCRIYNRDDSLVATGSMVDNMYRLDSLHVNKSYASTVKDDYDLWHRRLGHLNFDYVRKLQNMVDSFCSTNFGEKSDSS